MGWTRGDLPPGETSESAGAHSKLRAVFKSSPIVQLALLSSKLRLEQNILKSVTLHCKLL